MSDTVRFTIDGVEVPSSYVSNKDGNHRENNAALLTPIWQAVLGYGWYTFRMAFVGLALGTVFGIGLAVLMARFRVVERGLLPYVIASQTVPLIALAPQVVSWSGRFDVFGWEWPRWASVCVLAAFLSFFPIAVGTLRGLSSPPPAAPRA